MFNLLFLSKDCKAFYWITLDYFAYMGKWGAKENYWGQVLAVLGGIAYGTSQSLPLLLCQVHESYLLA